MLRSCYILTHVLIIVLLFGCASAGLAGEKLVYAITRSQQAPDAQRAHTEIFLLDQQTGESKQVFSDQQQTGDVHVTSEASYQLAGTYFLGEDGKQIRRVPSPPQTGWNHPAFLAELQDGTYLYLTLGSHGSILVRLDPARPDTVQEVFRTPSTERFCVSHSGNEMGFTYRTWDWKKNTETVTVHYKNLIDSLPELSLLTRT